MASEADRLRAERGYVESEEQPTDKALAASCGIDRGTVKRWREAGDWERKRREFWHRCSTDAAHAAYVATEAARQAASILSAVEVLEELSRIARGGMHRVATWGADGVIFRESSGLSPDDVAAVSEVSSAATPVGINLKIKLHSKLDALDKLAKHHGLYDPPASAGSLDADAGEGPPTRVVIRRGKSAGIPDA